MSDGTEKLVEQVKNGDMDSFQKLIDRFSSRIYALSYRFTGNAEDA
ncbi:RNA polymerase sigma factor [Candidatus Latescibacterota bacterium]